MRNQLFPDVMSAAEMDRQMDRRTGGWTEPTDKGRGEAEGKAACVLAGLAALRVLEDSAGVSCLAPRLQH